MKVELDVRNFEELLPAIVSPRLDRVPKVCRVRLRVLDEIGRFPSSELAPLDDVRRLKICQIMS